MRIIKTLALTASVLAFGMTAPAFAQSAPAPTVSNHPTTPAPAPSCGGNACVTTWTVGGGSMFAGQGGSLYEGTEGFNLIEKSGSGGVDIKLNADGGLCGVDCSDGGFTFEGFARETVSVSTGAFGDVSGTAVTAQNMGQAQGVVTFSLSKNFTAPAGN
jgi:hypothetical protein